MTVQYILHRPHELADLVSQTVASQRSVWARQVSFKISADGDVTLMGRVSSWYDKQQAQESLRRLAGIGRIRNQLAVCR